MINIIEPTIAAESFVTKQSQIMRKQNFSMNVHLTAQKTYQMIHGRDSLPIFLSEAYRMAIDRLLKSVIHRMIFYHIFNRSAFDMLLFPPSSKKGDEVLK